MRLRIIGGQRPRTKESNVKDVKGDISVTNALSINGKSNSKPVPEAASSASSELIESDQVDIEVQSPQITTRGQCTHCFVNLVDLCCYN